ncbi:hypothetical protein AB0M22_25195 [Nocardia sp. NPDC051756]|uniref:hypothetical protein n=1 Tax=Nocardia sp. NPDC051756 TaxID=3154751 RepID=UPI003440F0BB
MARLDELEYRVSVLEKLVGDRGETPFSANDALKGVRKRILSMQLSVIGMRRQLEELVDDRSSQGLVVAAIASHLGVKPPEEREDEG